MGFLELLGSVQLENNYLYKNNNVVESPSQLQATFGALILGSSSTTIKTNPAKPSTTKSDIVRFVK